MANESIYYILPSQKELEAREIVLDCLEKLRVLASAMSGNDYLERYADQLSLHQYVTLIDDLVEIAIKHSQGDLKT